MPMNALVIQVDQITTRTSPAGTGMRVVCFQVRVKGPCWFTMARTGAAAAVKVIAV